METAKMPHYLLMDFKSMVFIHDGILFSHKEEFVILRIMDGTGKLHLKGS
jgi:hypothetical protein